MAAGTVLTGAGGRALALHEAGDPNGFPVLMQHGSPGCGIVYRPHAELALEQGVRLIGYDRPGYGGSARHAGRSVADCAADVTAIADALGLERYATWGVSGGGPHALACAALCDERLIAVASLASPAPYPAEGLDWLADMGEANTKEFHVLLEGEEASRPLFERDAPELLNATVEGMLAFLDSLLGPADRAVLTDEFAAFGLETFRTGLTPGVDGWLDDNLAGVKPWGFELAAIDRPVLVMHGGDDRFVPVAHGRWLAERIPGVEARIDVAEGHLTLLERRMRETNEWLLAQR